MVQVNWTESAIEDLKEIHEHVARDSERYAKDLSARLRGSTRILAKHPKLGKPVQEIKDELFRELILGKYRVI